MTIPFRKLTERWMQDPAFRKAHEELGPKMDAAFAMAEARHRAGVTQAEIARRMETTQSVVARLESGTASPSIDTLHRYAKAVDSTLKIEFVPL